MEQKILDEVIRKHHLWLRDEEGGERADLSYTNLSSADLSYTNLRYTNLSSADLSSADLSYTNLRYTNLSSADLRYTNLRYTNLSSADLSSADLSYTDLSSADLSYTNLSSADLSYTNLSSADLSYTNLRYTNLRSADLRYTNLSSADLSGLAIWGTVGNKSNIKSLQIDTYEVAYTDKVLQIGCQIHDIKDWWKFDDETISRMDRGALDWWKAWKPILKKIIKTSPAQPTGFVEESEISA